MPTRIVLSKAEEIEPRKRLEVLSDKEGNISLNVDDDCVIFINNVLKEVTLYGGDWDHLGFSIRILDDNLAEIFDSTKEN